MTDAPALRFDPGRAAVEAFLDLQLRSVGLSFEAVASEMNEVYPRVAAAFLRVRNKYYQADGAPVLRLAHNAQFTFLLYLLSRQLSQTQPRHFADRVYWLLRSVSGADLYYEVELPDLWACDHPLGSVIGRARFTPSSTLFFAQNCNIGNNRGVYPQVDGNLHLFSGSSLLGDTRVEGNVVLANGACAIDAGDLSDCILFGRSPELTIKPLSAASFAEIVRFEL